MLTALCGSAAVVLAGLFVRERLRNDVLAAENADLRAKRDQLAADQRQIVELMARVPESFDIHDERDPIDALTPQEVAGLEGWTKQSVKRAD